MSLSSKAKLCSMTGYGRAGGQFGDWSWVWQISSVNSKTLNIKIVLPTKVDFGLDFLENEVRKKTSQKLNRGSVKISLDFTNMPSGTNRKINEGFLLQLISFSQKLYEDKKVEKPADLGALMAIKGVVEESQNQLDTDSKLQKELFSSLDEAIIELDKARRQEGVELAKIINGQMDEFEKLLKQAKNSKAANAKFIAKKFKTKLQNLLAEDLPEDRLANEAAILAVKADVREEIDRLGAHIKQARELLKTGSRIGRKLDFLAQEFIREINTLCSKSNDIKLTNTGLAMKAVIEQFREQAANVE